MGHEYRDEPTLASNTTDGVEPNVPSLDSAARTFGDYELLGEIARGGMGVVYKARQLSLNRIVALKMILSGNLARQEDVKRFYAEAESAARLEHPNIVPVYEIGEQNGQHFFTMGLVDGGSLDSVLKDSPLAPRTAVELIVKIADAIQYAHELGIVHRDLKPANILLAHSQRGGLSSSTSLSSISSGRTIGKRNNGDGGTENELAWIPKVSDFGLAKQMNAASDLTGTGQILGTPSYMPPEQANGKSELIGPTADIYALGAILYRMLSGRPPFQASSPLETILQLTSQDPVPIRQLIPSMPADLDTICLRCLQKVPSRRYQSARELEEDLRRWLNGDPILARPVSAWEKGVRWAKKHPAVSTTLAIGAVAVLAIVSILYAANTSLTLERDKAFQAKADADSQRQIAQSRLTRAIDVVDKMMARVASERWAMAPELTEERRQVLEDAVAFYNNLLSDQGDTKSRDSSLVRWESAKSQEQVAGVLFVLNELGKADQACIRGIGLCDELMAESPKELTYAAKKVSLLSLHGSVLALNGDGVQSLDRLRQAVELSKSICEVDPSNREYLCRSIDTRAYYAYFLLTGAQESRALGESLLPELMESVQRIKNEPNSPMEDRLTVAFALNVKSAYELSAGRTAAAKSGYEEALAIVQQLSGTTAPDARRADQYLQVRAVSLVNTGLCEFLGGSPDIERGLKHLDDGIEGTKALIRMHPKAFVYQFQYMQGLNAKGSAMHMIQKHDEGSLLQKQATEVLNQLIENNPSQPWLKQLNSGSESFRLVERVRAGDCTNLVQDARKIAENTPPARRMVVQYNIACAFSLASLLDTPDKKRFLEIAVTLLKGLAKDGYFDDDVSKRHAISDPDLAAVRDSVDLEALLRPSSSSSAEKDPSEQDNSP